MPCYAGLDVSQRDTQLCIVDAHGTVLWTPYETHTTPSADAFPSGAPYGPRKNRVRTVEPSARSA